MTVQSSLATSQPLAAGELAASIAPKTVITVMQGYVRIGTASTWDEARQIMRDHVNAVFWSLAAGIRTAEARDEEIARIDQDPDHGYVMVSGADAWAGNRRYITAGDKPRGIAAGDLAILRDYSNGHSWWTLAVKVRVIEVGSTFATIRVTGQSCQLWQHSVISVPLSSLRPRSAR